MPSLDTPKPALNASGSEALAPPKAEGATPLAAIATTAAEGGSATLVAAAEDTEATTEAVPGIVAQGGLDTDGTRATVEDRQEECGRALPSTRLEITSVRRSTVCCGRPAPSGPSAAMAEPLPLLLQEGIGSAS